MKRNRYISLLLLTIIILLMGVCLCACTTEDPVFKGDDVGPIIKGDAVDKATWQYQFSERNLDSVTQVTWISSSKLRQPWPGDREIAIHTYLYNNGYQYRNSNYSDIIYYIDYFEGNNFYQVKKTDGNEYYISHFSPTEWGTSAHSHMKYIATDIVGRFDEAVYDDETGCYLFTYETIMDTIPSNGSWNRRITTYNYKVKFDDGILVEFECTTIVIREYYEGNTLVKSEVDPWDKSEFIVGSSGDFGPIEATRFYTIDEELWNEYADAFIKNYSGSSADWTTIDYYTDFLFTQNGITYKYTCYNSAWSSYNAFITTSLANNRVFYVINQTRYFVADEDGKNAIEYSEETLPDEYKNIISFKALATDVFWMGELMKDNMDKAVYNQDTKSYKITFDNGDWVELSFENFRLTTMNFSRNGTLGEVVFESIFYKIENTEFPNIHY